MKTAKFRAVDVAKCLLELHGPMPQLQLQKLLYYCQGWSLIWDSRPLFRDTIEAWVNGPVVPSIWRRHSYEYELTPTEFDGDSSNLDRDARETIEGVLRYYGDYTPSQLVAKTHGEMPWLRARRGLKSYERGNVPISLDDMVEYFSAAP